ncbi:stigma-specific STIG1-like protein 1 [Cornus florida]|uniref:stigma-specific STIG1-like protein 1 n=1 Tax=Cornus florida TaxID=4283 RepID=UPI0028A00CA9|nr:stigma-specific STIG1-like protein 1 [Cornus florida]
MKCSKIIFLFATVMALAITVSATSDHEELLLDDDNYEVIGTETYDNPALLESQKPASLRGTGRFLAQTWRVGVTMTCNTYPRVCRVKGSPGPDCCKKKCVNVKTDRLNCGMCGQKCKYSEICCNGQCVNLMSNKKHCGGCNNKCKKRGSCVYGMCSYA